VSKALDSIAQSFGRGGGQAAGVPGVAASVSVEADADTGGVDIMAGFSAQLGRVADALEREWRRRERMAQVVHQIPVAAAVNLTGGAATVKSPDQLQAKAGYCWGIRRLSTWGWSAGTVTFYQNDANGEPVAPFTVAGVSTFGRGELLLEPQDQLVIVAAGITGNVYIGGKADCFPSWYEPYYLG